MAGVVIKLDPKRAQRSKLVAMRVVERYALKVAPQVIGWSVLTRDFPQVTQLLPPEVVRANVQRDAHFAEMGEWVTALNSNQALLVPVRLLEGENRMGPNDWAVVDKNAASGRLDGWIIGALVVGVVLAVGAAGVYTTSLIYDTKAKEAEAERTKAATIASLSKAAVDLQRTNPQASNQLASAAAKAQAAMTQANAGGWFGWIPQLTNSIIDAAEQGVSKASSGIALPLVLLLAFASRKKGGLFG